MSEELAVWWLTQEDYFGFMPCQTMNPLCIPDYIWEEFKNRHGRSGRGRLWISHCLSQGVQVTAPARLWSNYENAGGIVIRREDVAACQKWGGRFTDLYLEALS